MAASPNQKMIFMPYEATGIMGSVGGITELVSEALGKTVGSGKG